MDLVKYTAQLDLTDNGCFDTGWRIKQGDYGNSQLMISLVDNGVNAFDSNVIPQINFKRPDGKSVLANMTVEQNVYSYIFAGNELELAGTVLMDVKFITPQGRTSSASCKFTCVEDTIGIDPTGASTYYNPVAEVIEEAKELAEEVGGFAGAIEDLRQNKQNKLIAGRNITIDEETNVISASGGGGGGGTDVVANPTLMGNESGLYGLEVEGTKYKVADMEILTKDEYDALPDSKLTDNKMYYVKDWNKAGTDANVYSYDEKIVGDWFGKPLYRKVVEEAFGSYSSAHLVPIGVTNYTPVNYQAFRIAPDGTTIKAFNQQSNSGYWLSVEKFAADGIYYRSAGWTSGTFRAIVEYTKK